MSFHEIQRYIVAVLFLYIVYAVKCQNIILVVKSQNISFHFKILIFNTSAISASLMEWLYLYCRFFINYTLMVLEKKLNWKMY